MSEQPEIRPPFTVAEFVGGPRVGKLRLLDQTALPTERKHLLCAGVDDAFDAIYRLVVRGAPAIGVAAGYAMVLAAQEAIRQAGPDADAVHAVLREKGAYLKTCRPTAVNLAWAINRALARVAGAPTAEIAPALLDEAERIAAEDAGMCLSIGEHAAPLIERCRAVMTHCNAGALATAGIGTATAGMYVAHARGHGFGVYCNETRPLLQGSRLTAWELSEAGIEATVITDGMAGQVLKEGRVGMVITGADRIAANGAAANKIGTYALAIVARYHQIPFYVAAPASTFDLSLAGGAEIPIEQRGAEEVTHGFGRRTAPAAAAVYAPAFDVTPAELITGIVTDRGIIQPVNEANVRAMMG